MCLGPALKGCDAKSFGAARAEPAIAADLMRERREMGCAFFMSRVIVADWGWAAPQAVVLERAARGGASKVDQIFELGLS